MREIRRIWFNESMSSAIPATNIPGGYQRKVSMRMNSQGSFGQEEWDELQSICKEMYPEEELLMDLQASLLDGEKVGYDELGEGILNKLKTQIKRCYYKNEADAEAYCKKKYRI